MHCHPFPSPWTRDSDRGGAPRVRASFLRPSRRRRWSAALLASAVSLVLASGPLAQADPPAGHAGSLDTGFGGRGFVTTAIGSGNDRAHAMAIQADGRIVLAGYSHNDIALVRYTADGTLDDTFGTVVNGSTRSGKVTTAIGSGEDRAHAMAIQADGRIVVAGYSHNGNNNDFAVVRYTADGTLDDTFGTVVNGSTRSGKVTTAIGSGEDRAHAMAIQADGRIVVAGYSHNGNNNDFAVVRYTADGTLDDTFGTVVSDSARSGIVTTAIGPENDKAYAMAIQPDGRIVVAGFSYFFRKSDDFALVRYTAAGTLDDTFGTVVSGSTRSGKVTSSLGMPGSYDLVNAVAVQPDGRIVAVGYAGSQFALARYTADGAPDITFGADNDADGNMDGYTVTPIGPSVNAARAMALQPDGRIVAAGFSYRHHRYRSVDFALARYTAAGTLDDTFGTVVSGTTRSGKVTTYIGSGNARAYAMAIQADGRIVVAGSSRNGSNDDFAVARYHWERQNRAPTVAGALADATIANQSGTLTVSVAGTFSDADSDALTVTATSSDEAKATVSVAPDHSALTVTARARGTATITVTADDGNGGAVADAFTVTVKAAPVVASAIDDVSGLEEGDSQDVSLSGVFSDADGDALAITAASSDDAIATVTVASDGAALTLAGVVEGTATVTVTAQDSDGNRVSDTFDVAVEPEPELNEPGPDEPEQDEPELNEPGPDETGPDDPGPNDPGPDETATSDVVARYDADGDGAINIKEYMQSLRDYANGRLTDAEWEQVLKAYLAWAYG